MKASAAQLCQAALAGWRQIRGVGLQASDHAATTDVHIRTIGTVFRPAFGTHQGKSPNRRDHNHGRRGRCRGWVLAGGCAALFAGGVAGAAGLMTAGFAAASVAVEAAGAAGAAGAPAGADGVAAAGTGAAAGGGAAGTAGVAVTGAGGLGAGMTAFTACWQPEESFATLSLRHCIASFPPLDTPEQFAMKSERQFERIASC